jgi:CBS domain-containing protein
LPATGPAAWVQLALFRPTTAPDDRKVAEGSEMEKERVLVADVMLVDPIVVSPCASLDEAEVIIRSTFVTGIPVVDQEGVLVGVIGHAQLAAYRFGRPTPSPEQSTRQPVSAG